jgi:hypothetical protein
LKKIIKRVALGIVGILVVGGAGIGIFACVQASKFDASMEKVYDIKPGDLKASTDPAVIARGKHLAESVAACATKDCHGTDFGGGKTIEIGPLGTLTGPNISQGGLGAAYSDGELARIIRHGVKKDGRSVRFMPAQEINWMPDSDVIAVISYLRSAAPVDRPNGPMRIGTLGKVLDVKGDIILDVARRIDHDKSDLAPPPSPTPEYGKYLARMCNGCHGEHFSGGRIPGAPSSFPIPLNLTPHETGLKEWTQADFDKLLSSGIRKNGQKLNTFMPIEAIGKMDETERTALFSYLKTLPPTPFGQR